MKSLAFTAYPKDRPELIRLYWAESRDQARAYCFADHKDAEHPTPAHLPIVAHRAPAYDDATPTDIPY